MIYGYARVSTDAQDLTHQLAQLKAAGCAKIYREKISGATAERPQLKKLIAALEPGDVVIISAWFETCHFQVTPEIDRALMVKGFLVLGVTLI